MGMMLHLQERTLLKAEVSIVTTAMLASRADGSPMVRKELLVLLSCLVKEWRGHFVVALWLYWEEEKMAAAKKVAEEAAKREERKAWWVNVREHEGRMASRSKCSAKKPCGRGGICQ